MRLASALGDPVGSLVDSRNHLVLVLELGKLGGDHTEHHVLVLGQLCKWLEASGTFGIILEVIRIYVEVLML